MAAAFLLRGVSREYNARMIEEMTPAQLADELAAGHDLAIIDIRPEDAYADWHIPGAQNLPVIEAMRMNDPAPMQQRAGELPTGKPLVFVCNAGISSMKAAHVAHALGHEALSLAGGMRGWSIVHSEARVELASDPEATCIQVRRNAKGCLSYVLGSRGEAIVVDPSVDARIYQEIARREGLTISRVLETHVHADHVSRARELARLTNATLFLPVNDRVTFDYEALEHGDELTCGDLLIRVMATPGHTGESVCYIINDEIVLTGDTVFVDSVGRPDLEKGDEGALAGAEALFASLHDRVLALSDDVLILPCHTDPGVPFDGKVIGARLRDVRAAAADLLDADEETFVREIVGRIGAKPPSHTEIIQLNEGKVQAAVDPLDLEMGPNRCAVGMK